MLTLNVNIADATVQRTLSATAAVTPADCSRVAAEAGADTVRANFAQLASRRHRPRQRINYYLQAADSVIREVHGSQALIRIPHTGIAQRYYGGIIRPTGRPSKVTGKPVQKLAIGLSGSPAAGHTPADFTDLFLVVRKPQAGSKGGAYLARRKNSGIEFLFVLLSQVSQSADSTVLPPETRLASAAAEAILDLYAAAMEKTR